MKSHKDATEDLRLLTGVSLFSGGGIGDLALHAAGVDVLVASELLPDRASVFRSNYPNTTMVDGDIRETKNQIIQEAKDRLNGEPLDILFATPPCQGMSKNGRGKLLRGVRSGVKPKLDERNRLALDAVEIALSLRPKLVVFENVQDVPRSLLLQKPHQQMRSNSAFLIFQKRSPQKRQTCQQLRGSDEPPAQFRTAARRDLWAPKSTH